MSERADVVVGVIVRDRRILMTQRMPEKDFEFQWECPGGTVEKFETHHVALAREIQEELGCPAAIYDDPVFMADFEPPIARRPTRLFFYNVTLINPYPTWTQARAIPDMRAAIGLGWFTLSQAQKLDMSPGNAAFVEALCESAELVSRVLDR